MSGVVQLLGQVKYKLPNYSAYQKEGKTLCGVCKIRVLFSTFKSTLQSLKVDSDSFPFFILYFRRRKILFV